MHIVVPQYGSGDFNPRLTHAETDIASFRTALSMFQNDAGRYPTTAEGLAALINRPATIPDGGAWRRYLDVEKVPADPWGRPYIYKCPGTHNPNACDVYSLGRNGKGGDEAIGNWGPADEPESRKKAAVENLLGFEPSLRKFRFDCGRYPTTSEGLAALTECPPATPPNQWRGPYLQKAQQSDPNLDMKTIPADPWGHPYIYICPGLHNSNGYDVYSLGPEGEGENGVVGNWKPVKLR